MGKFIDLTGQKFGRLTVLNRVEDYESKSNWKCRKWNCLCECGQTKAVLEPNLIRGLTKSCGCYHKERIKEVCKKTNKYYFKGEDCIGVTTNDGGIEFIFDKKYYDVVSKYCWQHGTQGYICAADHTTYLHKLIIGASSSQTVDHIDRNKLNNKENNLRFCTLRENRFNKTKRKNSKTSFIGVEQRGKSSWRAKITCDKKVILLGTFHTLEDAIIARLKAEVKYFGDFAPQKHLFEQYGINISAED